MYSAYNKGKFVIAEKFIKTLNNKVYKYRTSISNNEYSSDQLNYIRIIAQVK